MQALLSIIGISLIGRKIQLVLALVIIPMLSATAQIYCVRAGATGANNGSDWNNAYSTLPAVLQRGATYFVADGSYGAYTFDDPASGTTEIIIKKATIASHGTSTGWSDSYGDGSATWNYWVILTPYYTFDGATRNPDWKTGYGFRVANSGAKNTIDLYYGQSSTARNVTFRFIEVAGLGIDNATKDRGIYAPWFTHFINIQSCYLHDFGNTPIMTGFCQNWLCENSVIARNSSDPVDHSEGWAGTADSNFVIRNNIFEDIEGTGFIVELNRGSGANTCSNFEIYGNVFMYSEGNPYNREGIGDGVIACINEQVAVNWKIYNNTMVNLNYGYSSRVEIGAFGTGNSNIQVYNNFWWRCTTAGHVLASCTSCEARWNRYDQTAHNSESDQVVNNTANTSAFVNYAAKDFRLASATAAGTTLSSPYNLDMNGNARGSDGVWDRGAYEYGGVADTVPPSLSGIAASSVGTSNAVILWTSGEIASSAVQYGTTVGYGNSASAAGFVLSHQVNLTGLQPNTLYHYRVTSADLAGNTTNSGDFTFTTIPPDLTAPTVSLTAPTGGTVSNSITLSATAADNSGGSGVSTVTFLVDGLSVGTDTTSPYSITWDSQTVANGSHTIQARAQDASGNITTSSGVTVTSQNVIVSGNGPVGYWLFNETTGTSATDDSGYGNTGVLTGGPLHVTGKSANGLQLDGVDDYVRVPNSSTLRVTNALTICAWVRLDSAGQWQAILEKLALEGSNAYPFSDYGLVAVAATNGFYARVTVTTAANLNAMDSTSVVSYGVWHHLAGTYDGSALKIYVDGALNNSLSVTGSVLASGQAVFIGRNGSGGDSLKGILDEVQIYNRALTASEIQTLFNGQAPLSPLNLRPL